MEDRVNRAIKNHASGYNCAQAVYCAFSDLVGEDDSQARRTSQSYGGGAKIRCGAVMAAELIFDRITADKVEREKLMQQYENEFIGKNQSLICRELRGGFGKGPLRSCRGCVTDSAEILEKMIETYEKR